MHAVVGQDFVFLTISTSAATSCSHCSSGNVIKASGSSTERPLYFGAEREQGRGAHHGVGVERLSICSEPLAFWGALGAERGITAGFCRW